MRLIERSIATPFASAAGWAILNSLWQGAMIATALACVLALTRSARLRYAAATLAMAAMAGAFTFTLLHGIEQGPAMWMVAGNAAAVGSRIPGAWRPMAATGSRFAATVPWLAPLWMAGVWIFSVRSIAGWITAQRLRRRGVCRVSANWQAQLSRLQARLRVSRPVMLLESCFADAPMTLGHFRPVILLPIGLVTGLPAQQIEAILLHELAHIRRWDYLVNVLETLVAGLLFYHPAIWWISRVIRAERENCCDDMAIAAGANAREYAFALAALEQNRHSGLNPAVAATGGKLMNRIRRILDSKPPKSNRSSITAALVVLATMVFAIVAQQSAAHAQTPDASAAWNKWLNEDVVYIITDQERAAFLKLATDQQREQFVEEFWLRRDPTPGTPENEFKEENYRRIAFANQHFASSVPGWKTDRGRIYITFGPPDEIDSHPSGGTYKRPAAEGGGETSIYPFENWRYRYIEGIGSNISVTFIDRAGDNDYRLAPGSPQ